MDVAESFGQRVDLTARLREILAAYPEGTTFLRELLQNAVRRVALVSAHSNVPSLTTWHDSALLAAFALQDDAGARVVRLCLDARAHGTESLAFAEGAPFQGAALLCYNDATFSDADFASISRIGDSVKRDQAGKTGRFGCGLQRVLCRAWHDWRASLTLLPLQDRLLIGLPHHGLA